MMMMTISSVENGMIGDYLDYYLRLISYLNSIICLTLN